MSESQSESKNRLGALSTLDFAILALVGVISGLALWWLGEHDKMNGTLRAVMAVFFVTLPAGFGMLWSRQNLPLRLMLILSQALLLTGISYFRFAKEITDVKAPLIFWIAVGGPLLWFLLMALMRASLRARALIWPYTRLWQAGVSLIADVVIALGTGLAAIAFIALWGAAFEAFGMAALEKIAHDPALLVPLGAGVATLAAGLARANARLGEAVRAVILIGCRIGLPLAAVLSLTFALALVFGGVEGLNKVPLSPGGLLLALALAAKLIFNGVYQDGQTMPPRWLRISTWVTLVVLPVYAVSAAYAIGKRVVLYGVTPPRMIALIALTLVAAYTLLLLAGLLSEFRNKTGAVWMPVIARLNTAMTLVWVVVLLLMQTPLLDPIGVSARNQVSRLLKGQASSKDFDYGYVRFKLGAPGRRAFARLEKSKDPQIIAGLARAKGADNYWDYKNPQTAKPTTPERDEKQKIAQSLARNLTIVKALASMAAEERYARAHLDAGQQDIAITDYLEGMNKRHIARLKSLLGEAPWFDPQKIGQAAERDAVLIVLYADHDPTLQKRVLKAIERPASAGNFDAMLYARLHEHLAGHQN